jgi:hypothetical protein
MSLKTEPLADRLQVDQRSVTRLSASTVGDVHSPWLWRSLVALSVITFAGLVYLTSYKNFFYDEWDFVVAYRPRQSTSILLPHNEHWSTIPILVWKVLFVLFGLRTHIPYEAVAIAGHMVCVLLMFELIRRRSGELPALGASLVLLVLGAGASNIVLAFQLTWTLSIAFGLMAMLVVETSPAGWSRRRIGAVAGLLLCSLMSSGLGLGFLAAISVQLLIDRSRRHLLIAVPPVLVVYLAWFIAYGSNGSPCGGCPTAIGSIRSIDPGYLFDVAGFEQLGLTASVVGIFGLTVFGLPKLVVLAILVSFIGLLAWHWYSQDGLASWEVGLLAGLVTQFTLVGLVRARLQPLGAADPHYVYVGVVYLLPLVANALKHISWHRMLRPVMVGALALIVGSNAWLLANQALNQRDLIETQNVELRVVELFRGAPDMALNSPLDGNIMPQLTAARYYAAVDELGSPVPASVPASLNRLSANAADRQLVTLFGAALTVTADAQSAPTSPCQRFDASTGSTLDANVPDGGSITIQASRGGEAAFSLGMLAPPTSRPLLKTNLGVATPERVQVPNTGRPVAWQLRIRMAAIGELLVCGLDHFQFHTAGL